VQLSNEKRQSLCSDPDTTNFHFDPMNRCISHNLEHTQIPVPELWRVTEKTGRERPTHRLLLGKAPKKLGKKSSLFALDDPFSRDLSAPSFKARQIPLKVRIEINQHRIIAWTRYRPRAQKKWGSLCCCVG
jgi:hypothetical protein